MSGREDSAPEPVPDPAPETTPGSAPREGPAGEIPATPSPIETPQESPAPADAVGHAPPTVPAGSRNGFWKGLGWFLAPIAVLAVGSMAGQDVVALWFVAVLFLLAALIGAVVFHVRKREDIGNGALTALALGAVILFGTCVYNLSHNL